MLCPLGDTLFCLAFLFAYFVLVLPRSCLLGKKNGWRTSGVLIPRGSRAPGRRAVAAWSCPAIFSGVLCEVEQFSFLVTEWTGPGVALTSLKQSLAVPSRPWWALVGPGPLLCLERSSIQMPPILRLLPVPPSLSPSVSYLASFHGATHHLSLPAELSVLGARDSV